MSLSWQWWAVLGYLALTNLGGAWDVVLDKQAAGKRKQRVPEARLLRWAWLGGWPLMAAFMVLVRHKIRKASFMRQFWLPVLVWLVGLAWFFFFGPGRQFT